jgi:hypothetical protein
VTVAPLDEVLGPPSIRERAISEVIAAMHEHDYGPDTEDEIAYADRHEEATAVLTRVAPLLVEYGRRCAGRALQDAATLPAWDGLDGLLRWRPNWRVAFSDGQPWWVYRAALGASIDEHLTVAVGAYRDPGGPTFPYLVILPPVGDLDSDGRKMTLAMLCEALDDLEAEVAGVERT